MVFYQCNNESNNDGYVAALSVDELIKSSTIQRYINEIQSLVAVPKDHFSLLYLSPLARYLAITQHCPRDVVVQHLQSVVNGLKQRRALLLPPGVTPEAISHKKDLWTYVVFVLLLMHTVGDQITGYAIVYKKTEDKETEAIKWCPFHSLLSPPYYFKVLGVLPISPYSSLALLPQIFEPLCLTWLYGDSDAINTVFDLMVSPNSDSLIGILLQKAFNDDSQVQKHCEPLTDLSTQIGEFPSNVSFQSIGECFYDWLIQAVNQPDYETVIIHTSEGISLLCPDIFKRFIHEHKNRLICDSWESVQEEFLALHRHTVNPISQKAFHKSQWPGRGACQVIIIPSVQRS